MLFKLASVLSLFTILSCVGQNQAAKVKPVVEVKPSPVKPIVPKVDCRALPGKVKSLPTFIASKSVVITEFLKSCNLADGRRGYVAKSSWTAMGFPCSGGQGIYDWKGSRYAPKLVSFSFANSCPMNYQARKQVEAEISTGLGIPSDSRLIAFYPFGIVYWEVPGYRDADVGYKVELFTDNARRDLWGRFQSGRSFPLKLYGKENALVRTKHYYRVDGDVMKDGEDRFKFRVNKVDVLNEKELDNLKKRCNNLRPRRNCSKIFS